ncbi:Hypothetical predicted protein [Olea europaea subsp. europaea]|uniref:Uncharacterized protein n=1 Tax=Olea europaea subsp. europaea TaxID=158383 RepID=A0A8S0TEU6_OLEEU|nr:Hypothetical predicted protein [Olea europaea subsp. europaea]
MIRINSQILGKKILRQEASDQMHVDDTCPRGFFVEKVASRGPVCIQFDQWPRSICLVMETSRQLDTNNFESYYTLDISS